MIDTSIPQFLDRAIQPDGTRMSTADIDALRLRLIKKHGTIKIKSPKLSNPKRTSKATGLGVDVKAAATIKGR